MMKYCKRMKFVPSHFQSLVTRSFQCSVTHGSFPRMLVHEGRLQNNDDFHSQNLHHKILILPVG